LQLDDLETEGEVRALAQLARVRAMRGVAHKIIELLAQLENFQKKLWLKKKFVVSTDYCVTLDKIIENAPELLDEVAGNEAQRREWVQLFAIDEILAKRQDELGGYSEPLTREFLEANPFLVLDTQFFSAAFKDKLLASFSDLDAQTDGLLIKSENFGALNLLQARYKEQVKCIYIDPPYNTGGDGFAYKDNYQHSSWLSMMQERLAVGRDLLGQSGVLFSSVDDNERVNLERLLLSIFNPSNRVEELIWVQNTTDNAAPTYSTNHEYIEVFARNRAVVEKDVFMFREPKPGYLEVAELIESLTQSISLSAVQAEIDKLMKAHLEEFKVELEEQGLEYDDETKKLDPWRGIYPYSRAEYRDVDGRLVSEDEARAKGAKIWVWQSGDASAPSGKQAESTRDPESFNYRFYRPLHPSTGKACPYPSRGWMCPYETSDARISFKELNADNRIVYGKDEANVPRLKRFLHDVDTNVSKSVVHDYTDGEKELTALMGSTNTFPNPKPTTLIERLLLQTTTNDDVVMDYFAGSGTTAHAVTKANRADGWRRRYILTEMGDYFESVLKPRIQKVVYSKDWKDGKPVSREGSSQLIKVLRLESYEDALNNLEVKKPATGQGALDFGGDDMKGFREDYLLHYMLDVETRGSASLLNIDGFRDPFAYELKIATSSAGETQPTKVDLVETFNYLLGLQVKTTETLQGFRVVTGQTLAGEKVLVIWRNLAEKDNAALDAFFDKQKYNPRDMEFDLIYVNGDNNLQNLRREDETWKVRLIEEEFQRLMFDVRDV